jgi:hypothetical protein
VLPVTADDKSWSVTSSDSTIATAGSSFLHAITMGAAQVRVRAHDADRRDTCFLTVMNDSAYASGIIPADGSSCYSALHTIRVAGGGNQFIVQNGGSVEMIAGEKILYLPGTKVEQGGYLHGYIAPQGPWCYETKSTPNSNDKCQTSNAREQVSSVKCQTSETLYVKVYPNPVSDLLTVSWQGGEVAQTSTTLILKNLSGKIVFRQVVNGVDSVTLSLRNLPHGLYFLSVESDFGSKILKIVR